MKRYKALNLMNNIGFWPDKAAIIDAIKEILMLGKCRKPLPVRDYGFYRDRQWRTESNALVPYQSVDWYVYEALDEDRMQVDSQRILQSFRVEPWRKDNLLGDHYDLFVMEEDMFDPRRGEGEQRMAYTVGKADRLTAIVISTYRIAHIWGMPYSYLKTEVMRQLCFMFGLPDEHRTNILVEGGSRYCANVCILRPASVAPDDWDRLTTDRLARGALCPECTADLQSFFEQAAREEN